MRAMAFTPFNFRERERRTKVFWVDPRCLLTYLSSMEHWPQIFGRAIIEGLPENAVLEDVRWDDSRRCLAVLVWHESYPIVPAGEITPEGGPGYLAIRHGWFIRQPDGSYKTEDDKQKAFGMVATQNTLGDIQEVVANHFGTGLIEDSKRYLDKNGMFSPTPLEDACARDAIPAEAIAGQSTLGNTAETEAEFFRKSIMAE